MRTLLEVVGSHSVRYLHSSCHVSSGLPMRCDRRKYRSGTANTSSHGKQRSISEYCHCYSVYLHLLLLRRKNMSHYLQAWVSSHFSSRSEITFFFTRYSSRFRYLIACVLLHV